MRTLIQRLEEAQAPEMDAMAAKLAKLGVWYATRANAVGSVVRKAVREAAERLRAGDNMGAQAKLAEAIAAVEAHPVDAQAFVDTATKVGARLAARGQ